MKPFHFFLLFSVLFFGTAANAQWQSTTYTLKGGWNAIYLSGDAKYAAIDQVLTHPGGGEATEVSEVWRWNPKQTQVQFTESPLIPSAGAPEWDVWVRGGEANTLSQLIGQTAYLVKCSGTSANTYSVQIKQSPLPPSSTWVRNGANLLGFPAFKTGSNYPLFSNYFATFPAAIAANTKIFKYIGGDLGAGNPLQVFSPTLERLDRTQAYWFSAEVVGNFYAPLEVSLSSNDGLAFGRTGSIITARIRNRTAAAITLTLTPTGSEAAPASQTAITGPVPLTRRTFDATTVAWTEVPITIAYTEAIGPQSTVELSFGVDRTAMPGAADALFASFLRLTDSGNLADIYLPVTATKPTLAGLWVGDVSLTNVSSRVTNTAKATAAVTSGRIAAISVSGSGGYGYATAPVVTIAPPPASMQPTATTAVTSGAVGGITLTNRGAGYVTAPTVIIAPPTSGVTATATATINAGVISTITITQGGSGYTGNPSITFSAPPASGATAQATASVAAGAVTGFTITNPGSGYAIASPKVTIADPPPLAGTTTPRPFPLRTLLHVADDGTARLLSKVFLGQLAAAGNDPGICTKEALLKQDAKAGAQRLVAAHLPLDRVITSTSGSVAVPSAAGQPLVCTIAVPYNDPTNPFLHQYHPDHDNKTARFANIQLPVYDSATATATITGDKVTGVTIEASGSGYKTVPPVAVSAPPTGTTAVVTATVTGGKVTVLAITNAGSGYVTAPTITIGASPSPTPTTVTMADGVEAPAITRNCAFTFTAAPPAGSTVTSGWGSSVIGGTYRETIIGIHKQTLQLDGTFELRRASEIGEISTN